MNFLYALGLFILLGACALLQPKEEIKVPAWDPGILITNESQVTPPREGALMTSEAIATQVSGKTGNYTVTLSEKNEVHGFSITNDGANAIVPKKGKIGEGPERQFAFHFPGRRAQDIELRITDAPSPKLSDLRETWIMFFPRKVVPAIELIEDRYKITIPTGEEFFLKRETVEIESGVLKEGPMDLRAYSLQKDLFPSIQYNGAGVWLQVSRRGESPHNGRVARIIKNAQGDEPIKSCSIHASQLWQQEEGTGNHFLFSTDADFDAYLKTQCGFGFL